MLIVSLPHIVYATTLQWTAPTQWTDGSTMNPAYDISAYNIYYGNASRSYQHIALVMNPGTTTVSIPLSLPTATYYFAVTTIDRNNVESAPSNEVSKWIEKTSQATATVTLGKLNFTYDGSSKNASYYTSPARLAVALSYNGSATVPSKPGTYTVVATVIAPYYQGSATGLMTISTASQVKSVPAFGIWGMLATAVVMAGYASRNRRKH